MKIMMMLCVSMGVLMSCSMHATVPVGYQTCRSDMDCQDGEYCGFVSIDTYAVCKSDHNIVNSVPSR
jgi:hypothetical protein